MPISEQTHNQVMAVLQKITGAVREGDIEGILGLVDPGVAALGAGPGERVVGKEDLHRRLERDLARVGNVVVELSGIRINAEGTVAWVMADVACHTVVDGATQTRNGRLTAVLRGTGHAWVFAQVHLSIPAA